jgi:hypothetical protein
VRAVHRRERKAGFRQDYFEIIPIAEIDKQINQLLRKTADTNSLNESINDEWMPPTPAYVFIKRARIADAFFGSNAELTDGEKILSRRIQAVSDLVALYKLRESSRRGKPFN